MYLLSVNFLGIMKLIFLMVSIGSLKEIASTFRNGYTVMTMSSRQNTTRT